MWNHIVLSLPDMLHNGVRLSCGLQSLCESGLAYSLCMVCIYIVCCVMYYLQATKLESLEAQIKNMALDHNRDLKKKDSEVN